MKYSKEQQEYHRSRIKRLMVMDRGITIRGLQKALEEDRREPMHLQTNYIMKLKNKITAERTHRYEEKSKLIKEVRLAEYEDRLTESDKQLWKIITDPGADDRAKVGALKELRANGSELLDRYFPADKENKGGNETTTTMLIAQFFEQLGEPVEELKPRTLMLLQQRKTGQLKDGGDNNQKGNI